MIIYNFKVNGSKLFKTFAITIFVFVILIFSFTIFKILKTSKQEASYEKTDTISNISQDNYTNILKTVHENLDEYIGKKINFSGYVYRIYDFNDNQFVLARNMVINSDMQTVVVGFLCESTDIKNFPDGSWITITGEIFKGEYHGEIPIIKVTKIENCKTPENEYVYPPDENYLQTPEI